VGGMGVWELEKRLLAGSQPLAGLDTLPPRGWDGVRLEKGPGLGRSQ